MSRLPHDTYRMVFGLAYLGLMVNLLLVVSGAPLVWLLLATNPALSWPFIAAALAFAAPGWGAAFSAFGAHRAGSSTVARDFWRGYRRSFRRALTFAATLTAALVVVAVDVRIFAATDAAVLIVPTLVVAAVLLLGGGVVGLVVVSEAPGMRLRDVAKVALYSAVRRWYVTVVSLAVIAVQLAVVSAAPAWGLGLTAAPALYVLWANGRYSIRDFASFPADTASADRAHERTPAA